MKRMTITLTTKSPVVLSGLGNTALLTVTRDTFSGTVLRGLAAARYIEHNDLRDAAHENADFRRLFFGGVRFVDAYPRINGMIAFPLPASLQKSKDGTRISDLFADDPKPGYKAYQGLGVITDGNSISTLQVAKSMTLHMSRSGELASADEASGTKFEDNRERLSGKSEEGHLFNYESVNEGQIFVGLLLGEPEDLSALRSALGDCWNGRAGRSKYTEYGEVKCELGEIEELPDSLPAPVGRGVWLRLQTPLLSFDGNATSAKDVLKKTVAEEMNRRRNKDCFYVGKTFANAEPIDSFVGVWSLRRPRQTALSAGSCFVLEKKDAEWDAEDMAALHALMYEGAGLRVEEGFGQLRSWEKRDWRPGEPVENRVSSEAQAENGEVSKRAEQILRGKIFEQIRLYAADDVNASAESVGRQPVHFFRQLEEMFFGTGFKSTLPTKLNDEASTFSRHLRETRVTLPGGKRRTLFDLLKSDLSAPYGGANRLGEIVKRLAELYAFLCTEPPKANDDDLIREYWKWFFRHARKIKHIKAEEATP